MNILQFEKVNCKNCYKCVRYCPVKAIEVKNHYAQILTEECILCGICTIVCPQKTKGAISETEEVKAAIRSGRQVIASVAPSFFAYYSVSFQVLREALLQLNFSEAYETAEGAYLVKSEYERLIAEQPEKVMISSCCSSVNLLIRKYYPGILSNLAPVLTPMQIHSKLLKERHPEAVIVFISPCISKKAERYHQKSMVDYTINFEELAVLLEEAGISFSQGSHGCEDQYRSRSFPVGGGILSSMRQAENHSYLSVSGYQACVEAIRDVESGALSDCFIEMSLCEGSCIGGPSFRDKGYSLLSARMRMDRHVHPSDYDEDYNLSGIDSTRPVFSASEKGVRAVPTEAQITAILQKMGKRNKADELNCSMCGYASCRDKAIAVIFGKAEITMCLPFMKERAESFSNQIMKITPNAILAVDMDLNVQHINNAACNIFRLVQEDIIGQPVSRILDEFDFVYLLTSDIGHYEKNTYLAEYNAYLNQIFLFDKAGSMVVCIMKDITAERQRKNAIMKKKIQAAAMADDIVDKQLRIVHEIASILGETAAETQIAIHDLKGTILMDDEE
ncbi:MAG: putative sensor protein [Bacillota bacterium]|jgi:iron only hydrogenase large subunit-like protein/uncharacterized Fe-S cluster-containing protein|nr:putative sensor protein [Bacillota bacterium]